MSSGPVGSPAWMEEFQEKYLKHGINDTDAQKDYLLGLAKHYENQFDQSKDWVDAFKAFSLYNANIEEKSVVRDDQVCRDMWRVISKYLFGGKEPKGKQNKKIEFFTIVKSRRRDLTEKRDILKNSLVNLSREVGKRVHDHPEKLIEIVIKSNDMMVSFAGTIIDEAIKFLGSDRPPCDFSAVGIGSLGRGEATPYSDLEYLFLIEKSKHRPYFEKLAVLTYCIIGALNETKLNSIAIHELNGEKGRGIEVGWFIDGRQYGYQIDGITSTSDNVPTRAKSMWMLEDSGGFIATPNDLVREYKAVLDNPTKEALKGDITSMLMFTKLLYAITNGKSQYEQSQDNLTENLLASFAKQRDEINCHKNDKRVKINLEMLENDLNKFVFHPEYDLYSSGFNMNVKTELYRFPSILLLDLTTVIDEVGLDSWKTLDLIRGKFSEGFADHLSRLLAFACFSRLRCYLAMNAHSDSFKIGGQQAFPSGVGDTDHSIGYRVSNTWEMSRDEFFLLCRDLITMQRHMRPTKEKPIKSPDYVTALMSANIEETPLAKTMAHYYCCEWTEVIQSLDGYYRNSMDYQCRIALAFSYLQLKESSKASKVLEGLRDDLSKDKAVSDAMRINVLRLLAGSTTEALSDEVSAANIPKTVSTDPYEGALNAIEALPTNRREKLRRIEAFVLFEHGLFLSKGKGEKSTGLDFLYDSLKILILDAATQPKCSGLRVLKDFKSRTILERLDWIGNDTRELAHCLYSIATLLQDKEVARKYRKKASQLGLDFYIQHGTDTYTQIMILTDLGKALNNKQYLKGALALLERSVGKDSSPELKTEVMVSIVECIGQAGDKIEHSVELENQLELQLDRVITDSNAEADEEEDDQKIHMKLLNNERTDSWYSRAIKALKDIPTDLTEEEKKQIQLLRDQFAILGKDTSPFDEAVEQSKPKTSENGTQTEPPPKEGTKSIESQTYVSQQQSFDNAEVQTDLLVVTQDGEAQTYQSISLIGHSATQTNAIEGLASLRDAADTTGQHLGVECDFCHIENFSGLRFVCGNCEYFNLCSGCEARPREEIGHDVTHLFIKLKTPVVRPFGQHQPPREAVLSRYTDAIKTAIDRSATQHSYKKTEIKCDICKSVVSGVRYRCGLCHNYDICERCEAVGDKHHNVNHVFIKIPHPLKPNVLRKAVLIPEGWLRQL